MTLLRYTIYGFGGLLICALYGVLAVNDTVLAANPWVFGPFFVFGFLLLPVADSLIHHRLYGYRAKFRLKDYTPCPICPLTGEQATEPRHLRVELGSFSFVQVMMTYKLPILISKAAAKEHPEPVLDSLPGWTVVRFTSSFVVLYLCDRTYYLAFVAANERAIM
jgi:hypothetical protein